LTERHLNSLVDDTASALDLLAKLSASFKTVESQTTTFQAQCEDLLAEQKRLRDLANEVGTDLAYYGYLEPLTRRLNHPGAGRLVRNDDFLDTLINLNTCITFMDQHVRHFYFLLQPLVIANCFLQPTYRDSNIYKTRYITLLQRSLGIVQTAFSSALREVSDEVSKQLKAKEHNETAEYVLLYGNYETIAEDLGSPIKTFLNSKEFAFGRKDDRKNRDAYISQYHELFKQLTESYLKSREPVGPLVLKNLRKFAVGDLKDDSEFKYVKTGLFVDQPPLFWDPDISNSDKTIGSSLGGVFNMCLTYATMSSSSPKNSSMMGLLQQNTLQLHHGTLMAITERNSRQIVSLISKFLTPS